MPEHETLQKAFPNFQFYVGSEPLQFFIDKIKEQYKKNLFNTALPKVAKLLPSSVDDAERELQKLLSVSRSYIQVGSTLDSRSSAEVMKGAYEKREAGLGVDGYSTSWPFLDKITCGFHPEELIILMGRAKMGKGIPLHQELPTPNGFVEAKDIRCGDYLFGADGLPTKVISASDVHNLPCYRITFNDGSSIVTDKDHLWSAYYFSSEKRNVITISTEEMFLQGTKNTSGKYKFAIPLTKPIKYAPQQHLPMDPYVLGLWLGYCSDKQFTQDDRHIPEIYRRASVEQRLALLNGLIDSGEIYNRWFTFCNTSIVLCKDILELVNSLGGIGRIKRRKNNCYAVIFQFMPDSTISLERKEEKRSGAQNFYRGIVDISPVESEATVCFMVDAPDSLYLVGRNYFVTHNSWLLTWMMHHIWKEENVPCLYITKEMGKKAIRWRFDAIDNKLSFDRVRQAKLTTEEKIRYYARLDEIETKTVSGEYAYFGIHGFDLTDSTSGVSSLIPHVEKYLGDKGILFVDGIYLMSDDAGEKDWKGIVNVSKDLKILGQTYNIPVVATTQQSMEDKSDVPRLENAAYGRYIVQYADLILAIGRSDVDRQANRGNIYTLGQREGDIGNFPINMKFDPVDFTQCQDKTIDDFSDEDDEDEIYYV